MTQRKVSSFMTNAAADLTRAEKNLLDRFIAHLAERGVDVPDTQDFRAFGSVSTLRRLQKALARTSPDVCGPLRLAISDAAKERRRPARPKGSFRGRVPVLAIPAADLRPDWIVHLADMRERTARRDAGLLLLSGPEPMPLCMIADLEYLLRAISRTCLDASFRPELSIETVRLWLDREDSRGRRATGLSFQLRLLGRFIEAIDGPKKLRKALEKLGAEYATRGRKLRKKKHFWLAASGIGIGDVWIVAEDLLAKSRQAPAGSARKYNLALHACVMALSINAPLRIGDLHRVRVGVEICRDARGWSLETGIRKTHGEYEVPELWPETQAFLDEVLKLDAAGGDLWVEYDRRAGTPLFSLDGGRTGLSAEWVSSVFQDHIGTGQHIVRTMWHQLAYENDVDLTWMALALCGQRGVRTEREYRERTSRRQTVRAGRQKLSSLRRREVQNNAFRKVSSRQTDDRSSPDATER